MYRYRNSSHWLRTDIHYIYCISQQNVTPFTLIITYIL